ncbi:MAG TPA: phytanoyl-CoA dioxygenase family protein [Haliangiales bacterium]|nr:phytanoyl-CoA dioxygenase family protein [Haliangiales bacterium]
MLTASLTADDLAAWRRDHYLVLRRPFADADVARLRAWTDEVAAWPETPGAWMKYFETTDTAARQICRIENFVPFHAGFRELLCGAGMMAILERLMGEPAALFKEKINLKLAGGGGFAAHQDAPAFVTFGQRYHITVAVAIDAATVANGCLEVSDSVDVYRTLPQAPGGSIDPAVEAVLPWRPLELAAGDVALFDSYLPHRSRSNRSAQSRRALYVTYNRRSEGERREEYFAHKRASFPPECERVAGVDYRASEALYNLGNPIR